jgi:competence protein ComEC
MMRAFSTALVFVALGGWTLASFPWVRLPDEALRIWFFDIGQGDAIFIETPTGEQILIDSGRDRRVLAKLGSVMPPWDRTLDAIILTHPDADHVGGFPDVLARYDVAAIYETGITNRTDAAEAWEEAVRDEAAPQRLIKAGSHLVYGNATLETVWPLSALPGSVPKEPNRFSLVFLLRYGGTTLALTGDATVDEERRFASALNDVDVLKVGHHGSRTSSDAEFLSRIHPEIAVVSVGEHNLYGHPTPEALSRLRKIGAQIFRTDLDGDVLLTSFGGEPTVAASPLPF